MSYKRILSIQDISCVGQCSLTTALPIVSACGIETCILPSAVLSTHTGGFKGFTFRDLTDDIPDIKRHWQSEEIGFDAFYTGYLGSRKQIAFVKDILLTMGVQGSVSIVDPAMADDGKLYPGFDNTYVKEMKSLCSIADIVLPNITEASFLTGMEYRESYDEAYVAALAYKLEELGAKNVVLTGIGYRPGMTGVAIFGTQGCSYYEHIRLAKSSHGTGDVYASAFVGSFMNGLSLPESARIAADYTVMCIENTQDDENHWYGVKFETAIPELLRMLGKI